MKNIKTLLLLTSLTFCATIAYGSREHDGEQEECEDEDDETDEEEAPKCRLPNGEKIDCKYCMQDGGCKKPTNIITNKLKIFISDMYRKIRLWAGS